MKGYKAFNIDWKCRGFQYKIGKTYEHKGELVICEQGFHFCKNPIDVFAYYPFSENTKIAEVEALGEIVQEGTKYCTNKIRIIKEFTHKQLQALILDGKYNTGGDNSGSCNSGNSNSGNSNSGSCNSGDNNSGSCNSGSCNSGNRNSGNSNSGYWNSGSCNSGDSNSGSCNSGDYNSGNCNSGNRNSGRCNSGNCNSGDGNSGNSNSGDGNSGNSNSGNCNSGNCNSGFFNSIDAKVRLFNYQTDMTFDEFYVSCPVGLWGHIRENKLSDEDIVFITGLPHFDADIFEKCTGIRIKEGE